MATPTAGQAWFHPSSVNSSPERAEPGLFVFVDKVVIIAIVRVVIIAMVSIAVVRVPMVSSLFVFVDKVLTSRLFLRGTTRVPPAALLLFGASPSEIDVERVKQCGRVDLSSGARVRLVFWLGLVLGLGLGP